MTTLPATYVESAGVALAREWIARGHEGNFLGLGCGPLSNAGRAFARMIIKQWAGLHPFNMDQLVQLANAGWDDADLALREMIAEYVDRGKALPSVLAAYNVALLNPHRVRPARPHGRHKATNILQDIFIVTLAMELMVQFPGLKPTRSQNGKKRQPSACSNIAAAQAGLQRGDERAIQQVLLRYFPAVFPGSRAEAVLAATRGVT
jgi:hypothetical protein